MLKTNSITSKWKMMVVLLTGVVAVQEFSRCETAIVCEARAGRDEKEVEKFIEGYYGTYMEKDPEILKVYMKDEEDLEEELLHRKALSECGCIGYDYIDALVYPLSDGAHWIAFVNSELVIEDLEDALPGARAMLVGKSADGDFYIEVDDDCLDQDLIKEMREIALSDEVYDRTNEVQCRYNEMLADNPDVLEWVMEASDIQTRVMAEAYEEKSRKEKDYYLVKKGDCLWSIAENELGDGMYWGDIYEINRDVIGNNPDLLYVGIRLSLPED